MQKQFRKAFVTDPVHDISAILPYAEEIHFILDGRESYDQIRNKVDGILPDFDNQKDVIIPMGSIVTNFIVGLMLPRWERITIGIYHESDYQFIVI